MTEPNRTSEAPAAELESARGATLRGFKSRRDRQPDHGQNVRLAVGRDSGDAGPPLRSQVGVLFVCVRRLWPT